jgi:isocitrate/isopropylmalate dehydrogenase
MLDYLGETQQARRIESAVNQVIVDQQVTADLGGKLGTQAAARAVISQLGRA